MRTFGSEEEFIANLMIDPEFKIKNQENKPFKLSNYETINSY